MRDFTSEICFYVQEIDKGCIILHPFEDFPECTVIKGKDRQGNDVGILAVPKPTGGVGTDIFSASLRSESLEYGAGIMRQSMRLIVIHEDLWWRRPEVAKGRIAVLLGHFRRIMARDCIVREISAEECRYFLERYHAYGYTACKYKFGIFGARDRKDSVKKGELVGVATFSGGRRWMKPEGEIVSYEWVRYASLPDTRINGGMTKAISAFVKTAHPDDIMSYADLECADSGSYSEIGFTAEGFMPPQAYLVNGQYEREPLKRLSETDVAKRLLDDCYIAFNFGSRKYRMRITAPISASEQSSDFTGPQNQ